ncbi:MAG: hypothetical protein ACI8RD_007190 [Bacillariaceae sp.]|jgi:hypothetical protein
MTNKDELEKKISHITIHALNQLSFDRVDVGAPFLVKSINKKIVLFFCF